MDFVGRDRELDALAEAYRSRSSAFVPIYGRRRVGKSELILRFIRDKPAVYFVGKKGARGLLLGEYLREAAVALDQPLIEHLPRDQWKRALLETVAGRRTKGKLVLVLDEFQWIAASSPELTGVLQECWDRRWQRTGDVMLIVCGSMVGFMVREVLGKQSPLFGRRTAQIHLRPLGYREAAKFHPRWSTVDRARAYFLCGGIPLYLKLFDDSQSVEANIQRNMLHPISPLYHEPSFLVREELREVEIYYAVLLAIAQGRHRATDIAAHAGVDARALHYYLQQLCELGYLGRHHPLAEGKVPRRGARYVLDDPLLRFWFRFVYPNTSYIEHMGPRQAFQRRVAPELDAYFGTCFETLCREALPAIYAKDGVDAGVSIGQYWDKQVQIDVVALRDDNWTDLGECKWGAVRSPKALAGELEQKVAAFPNRRGASIGRHCFVKQRPKRAVPGGARWHSLEQLYEL